MFSGNTSASENSMVAYMQEKLLAQINYTLAAIAADVGRGLSETVGLKSEWWTDDLETASVVIRLPEDIDADDTARAINLENLEAWVDDEKRLHIGISPFLTTKDVDQTVLCVVKVACQFTGLIDVDADSHSLHHRH